MQKRRILTRRRFLATSGTAGTLLLGSRLSLFGGAAATSRDAIRPFAVDGNTLVVPPGRYRVADREVMVSARAALHVSPADVVQVRDEEILLSDKKPAGFFVGTQLKGTKAKNIGAFHSLIANSVVLRTADGRTLRKEEDYLVAPNFALLGLGNKPSVTATTKVYASYSHYLQRVDMVAVDARGAASLIVGTPQLVSPEIPALPAGSIAIAHVYRPFMSTALEPAHVFPIVATSAQAPTATTRGLLPKTRRKLESGEPATIVCWGDSITVGADVAPEEAWANRVVPALQRHFPRAKITHRNHSIGGTKTAQWLHNGDFPGLPKQNPEKCRFENVLNEKPDLVVMEFLNDIVFDEDVLQRIYASIHEQFAARGIEWLIVTPSQKMPEDFALGVMKDEEPRLLDTFLRRFAHERGHALADAAARWKHLYREGVPYFGLFNNGYNHPNAFGHGLFIEEIMKCFEA